MRLDARVIVGPVLQRLTALEKKQIPFATAYALTQTAKLAQASVEKEIAKVFDAPTAYTRAAARVQPATKKRLIAEVFLKDESVKGNPAVRYLLAEVKGGSRTQKGFEKLLQRAAVMPWGWYAVPTKYAPIDAYGNVPGRVIVSILAQLQASNDQTVAPNETSQQKKKRNSIKNRSKRRLSRYFTVLPGRERTRHLTPGIWERVAFGFGTSVRPVFLFVASAPRYRTRLAFDRVVGRVVANELETQLAKGFALARSTAR